MIHPVNTHPEDVRAMVRKRGTTLTALAARNGLHPSALSHSLRRCIPTANRAIARYLGLNPSKLWPQWFDDAGERRSTRRANRGSVALHRANRRLAIDGGTSK